MDFQAAFRFPFKGEQRWANLGFVLVCMLIPVVGPIVATGYLVLVEKRLIADIDAEAPRFDFGQFTDYLMRGLYPFLVSLVIMLPAMILIFMPLGLGMAVMIIGLQKKPVLLVGGIIVVVLLEVFLTMAVSILPLPIVLKAGLEKTFEKAFSWTFFKSWWQTVGWVSLGALLLLSGAFLLGYLVTVCTFIGPYLLMPVLFMIQGHVKAQLYRLHVARGGVPLVIVQEQVMGMPPVFAVPPMQAGH